MSSLVKVMFCIVTSTLSLGKLVESAIFTLLCAISVSSERTSSSTSTDTPLTSRSPMSSSKLSCSDPAGPFSSSKSCSLSLSSMKSSSRTSGASSGSFRSNSSSGNKGSCLARILALIRSIVCSRIKISDCLMACRLLYSCRAGKEASALSNFRCISSVFTPSPSRSLTTSLSTAEALVGTGALFLSIALIFSRRILFSSCSLCCSKSFCFSTSSSIVGSSVTGTDIGSMDTVP
mmetsp:Transcript_3977/g.11925  ORF Transcript_3977/g.11925 Transcript_3977/m.11925 type:complete len:234 (-) Transcript_3977:701-1402(-)